MELINLSKEDYSNYKTLINSNISEEYFNNFIDNILNENHLIIVLKKDIRIKRLREEILKIALIVKKGLTQKRNEL